METVPPTPPEPPSPESPPTLPPPELPPAPTSYDWASPAEPPPPASDVSAPVEQPPTGLFMRPLPPRALRLEMDYPERLSRRLLFVKWLPFIPRLIRLYFYGIVLFIAALFTAPFMLVTGRSHQGFFNFGVGYLRFWSATFTRFPLLLYDHEWEFDDPQSPGVRSVQLEIERPERLSRFLVLLKAASLYIGVAAYVTSLPIEIVVAAAIPAFLTYLLMIVLTVVAIPAWFAILITGRYPRWLFNFQVAGAQMAARIIAWQYLLRDEWPWLGTTRRQRIFASAFGILATAVIVVLAFVPITTNENAKTVERAKERGEITLSAEGIRYDSPLGYTAILSPDWVHLSVTSEEYERLARAGATDEQEAIVAEALQGFASHPANTRIDMIILDSRGQGYFQILAICDSSLVGLSESERTQVRYATEGSFLTEASAAGLTPVNSGSIQISGVSTVLYRSPSLLPGTTSTLAVAVTPLGCLYVFSLTEEDDGPGYFPDFRQFLDSVKFTES